MKSKIFIVLLSAAPLFGLDEAFFYRATPLFEPTRIARRGLTTVDMSLSYGSTKHARPGKALERTVSTWDCWGLHVMQQLGVGVPGKNLSNPLDFLLEQLELERSRIVQQRCTFEEWATFAIDGRLRIVEAALSGYYSITDNFFVHANLPLRVFLVGCPCFIDRSPTDDITPNAQTPLWLAFQNSFDAILARYNLSREPSNTIGIGDLSLYAGFTCNYQESKHLDFVDITLQIGVIAPTGKKKNPDKLFSFATGYDGHVGIGMLGDIAFGFYDWLTFGAHINVIGFFDRSDCIRIKTAMHQSGIIYLAKEKAKIQRGTQINGGIYAKADHVAAGFSATLGYSFAQKNSDTVTPCNTTLFSSSIASSEGSRLSWKMHTIHLNAEYDFSRKSWPVGPRVALFYDAQVAGRRVLKTNMVGGAAGIDCMVTF
jgi:hypothetical protein